MKYRFSMNDAISAAEAKNKIEGWEGYSAEFVDDGFIIEGCVPDGVYSEGKHKGKSRLDKPVSGTTSKSIVSNAELTIIAEKYEESGGCFNCKGSGEVFASWDHKDGVKHKSCRACDGSGKVELKAEMVA